MEDDIERWTAKRKMALILDIIEGKTMVLEVSLKFSLVYAKDEFKREIEGDSCPR